MSEHDYYQAHTGSTRYSTPSRTACMFRRSS